MEPNSERKWNVKPAWTADKNGNPRRCGWHLMNGGEYADTFHYKRDAQEEADKQNEMEKE